MERLRDARVFVTGHTGFKGSWFVALCTALGARVTGYALAPATAPSLFEEAGLASELDHHIGDVRDLPMLAATMEAARPDLVVHLAAQSLVLAGYDDPVGTFAINTQGTANVLEAIRRASSVRAAVIVTSDKCYRPNAGRPLAEGDPMGGDDPYSASKGAAELVTAAYRNSFFSERGALIATARAGNVIGGGDWSADRLIADLARAMRGTDREVVLRNPQAVRPWQHVFDALYGYLMLASVLLAGGRSAAKAWNFGPLESEHLDVRAVVDAFSAAYGEPLKIATVQAPHPENPSLRLDSSLARTELGWRPVLEAGEAVASAAHWYRRHASGDSARRLLDEDVRRLLSRCEVGGA